MVVFFARQSTKYLTLTQIFLLWSPNFSGHPCKDSESVPLGPALPESFRATDLTTSSIISTGIKKQALPHTLPTQHLGFFLVQIFPANTYKTVLSIKVYFSCARSLGNTSPPSPVNK